MIKFFKQTAFFCALICSASWSAVVSLAQEQTQDFERLNSLLSKIDTLSANVLQRIVESDGGILEESKIQMFLKKPDGFYWETLTPFAELIVTNGSKLWNYQADLEQVVIEDWDSSRSELAAQLLGGETKNLAEEYTIESITEQGSKHQEFKLTPIAADNVYQLISISFMLSELESIYLGSKNGQQTVWHFENVIRNQPIADVQFEFLPAENIEIIENSYKQ